MRIFALRDVKMQLFMNPMFFNSRAQAQRVVQDEVNRSVQGVSEPPTTLQTHPEDIELYEIGEFDNTTGVVTGPAKAVLVVNCKELVLKG